MSARKNGRARVSAAGGLLATALDEVYAEYGRVSTDEQADAGTIQNQREFLTKYRALYALPLAGQYYDDGVSGTVPLNRRPEGRRLLEDARAGTFRVLLVYRLDRLGRDLMSMLEALRELDACGVTIRSTTEPFDTATSIGRFIFQLLGALAELEKSTIGERLGHGRDRVAAEGRYTGGTIPTGYEVDADGQYVPCRRPMPGLGLSEADWITDLFERVAAGSTSMNAERIRLSELGVPKVSRYSRKGTTERGGAWGLGTLSSILHNPIYMGAGALDSRFDAVVRPVVPLVDPATWTRAQEMLLRNRTLAKKNAKADYLLRGLITCAHCRQGYTGVGSRRSYRCNGAQSHRGRMPGERCIGATVSMDALDAAVWAEVRRFVEHPDEAVALAQADLRARLEGVAASSDRRRALAADLAGMEEQRARVRMLFRRGKITPLEAEADLDAIAAEEGQVRGLLAALAVRADLAEAAEAHLSEVAVTMATMRGQLADIEATDDRVGKRRMVELLVSRLEIETEPLGVRAGGQRRRNVTRLRLRLALARESSVVSVTKTSDGNYCPSSGTPALSLDRLLVIGRAAA
jgi:site-specific DNA recombinase